MRNQYAHDGPLFSGPVNPTPSTPVEKLRGKIGIMADCLTRMLGAISMDEVKLTNLLYLEVGLGDLDHHSRNLRCMIVELREGRRDAAACIDDVQPDELRELTRPATDAAAEKGGGA